jgi:glycosyltransferase involved in cell wall biosynthesis
MSNPSSKVSIVLPTYNGAMYLRRSIDSCLNQTHRNIELIVVDDGSTDDTPEIVSSIRDRRASYVKHDTNRGLPLALNTGFAKATGDYLTWTSDDNFYDKDAIQQMASYLTNGKHEFVYCDFYRFTRDDLSDLELIRSPDTPALLEGNNVGPCFLYSRRVKDAVGEYDQDAALSEDYDYWIRASKRFSIHHLAEPLYFYRHHLKSSLSRYYEIQMVGALVRVKNEIQDVTGATQFLLELMSQTQARRDAKRRILKPLLSTGVGRKAAKTILATSLARRLYVRRIDRPSEGAPPSANIRGVLTDFSAGRLGFKEAKLAIGSLVLSNLSAE